MLLRPSLPTVPKLSMSHTNPSLQPTMTLAEAAAAISISSALARIRAGEPMLALEPLEHALKVLAEPLEAAPRMVRDAELFREFAEASARDDGRFEKAALDYPAREPLSTPLEYFRGLVEFASKEQYMQHGEPS